MGCVLGIDIGTSSLKAVVVNSDGVVEASHSVRYPLNQVREGWFEQDPSDWVNAAHEAIHTLRRFEPLAIGLAGQMHGLVTVNENGEVIRPAILWNDVRSVDACDQLIRTVGLDRLVAITGNVPSPGLQFPKLLWMRNNEREPFSAIRKVFLPKDYVAYRLTGHAFTEPSDASGTGCFDVNSDTWSQEILRSFEIADAWFPTVMASTGRYGSFDGVPVVGGAGDQAGAAIGLGLLDPGQAGLSLGSSGVVILVSPRQAIGEASSVNTFRHATDGLLRLGVSLNCGMALNHELREFSFETVEAMESAAASAHESGHTYLPFIGGERCPFGSSHRHRKFITHAAEDANISMKELDAKLARAVFEGITANLALAAQEVRAIGGEIRGLQVTGGGANSAFWCQLIADAFQVPVSVPNTDDGPALGAAILAGMGVGMWPSVKEAPRPQIHASKSYQPAATRPQFVDKFFESVALSIDSGEWTVYSRPKMLPQNP